MSALDGELFFSDTIQVKPTRNLSQSTQTKLNVSETVFSPCT